MNYAKNFVKALLVRKTDTALLSKEVNPRLGERELDFPDVGVAIQERSHLSVVKIGAKRGSNAKTRER